MLKNKKDLTNLVAKTMVNVLNGLLHIDANSASCLVAYQPKAPKELERFKKKK